MFILIITLYSYALTGGGEAITITSVEFSSNSICIAAKEAYKTPKRSINVELLCVKK